MFEDHLHEKGPLRIRMRSPARRKDPRDRGSALYHRTAGMRTVLQRARDRFAIRRDRAVAHGSLFMRWPRINGRAHQRKRWKPAYPGCTPPATPRCVPADIFRVPSFMVRFALKTATVYADQNDFADPDVGQIDAFLAARNARLSQNNNRVPIEEFEYKVRRIINDYIRPPKNEFKLNRALWWMDRFREELATMVAVRDIHDLFKVYEVENIIQCATLSAVASKERTESRWGPWHYRSDYPESNDDNWLKHIVLTRGERSEDVRIYAQGYYQIKGERQ